MPKNKRPTGIVTFCVALCVPMAAHGSGQTPTPPVTEQFKSHSGCVAGLEARYKEDVERVRTKSIKVDGSTSHVELNTGGIERVGRDSARYDATIWYHHGRIRDDLQQKETSHSYAHRLHVCEGKTMRTTGEDGYTSSTFEPLPVVASTPQRLDCRVRLEDCAREIAIVEETIKSDPALAALRRAIDVRIGDMKRQAGVSTGASAALDEDEARYRRSLRRDLYILADGSDLVDGDRSVLRGSLSWRLAELERMSLAADQFVGVWSNASGALEVTPLADGRYYVEANPVDIDHLKWTCELSGEGRIVNGVLAADLGAGERLELSLENGLLRSEHERRETGYSGLCGEGGHGDGTWFSTRPEEKTKKQE